MNKPTRSVSTPMTRVATGRVSLSEIVAKEPEAGDARAALFLVWSGARAAGEAEAGRAEGCTGPARAGRRDRGLWLFRDAVWRREGWLQLHAEPATVCERAPARGYAAAKRACDVAVAVALLALLAPVLALVALLIRLDSPGPAIFRQRRVGKDGAEFLLWKFRSMGTDAPPYARSPTSDRDARLTRAGRLIRRVSLDELPQLFNVLGGDEPGGAASGDAVCGRGLHGTGAQAAGGEAGDHGAVADLAGAGVSDPREPGVRPALYKAPEPGAGWGDSLEDDGSGDSGGGGGVVASC